MLTRTGFELASLGYRSAALPVELSNPQGLVASFYQTYVHRDIFQLTSAVSDYRKKFLFLYISEDDSEIQLSS